MHTNYLLFIKKEILLNFCIFYVATKNHIDFDKMVTKKS